MASTMAIATLAPTDATLSVQEANLTEASTLSNLRAQQHRDAYGNPIGKSVHLFTLNIP